MTDGLISTSVRHLTCVSQSNVTAAASSTVSITLTIDHAVATPIIKQFAAFAPCAEA